MARHPFCIDAMVILPDHLHCIWTLPEGDWDFSTRWRLVKAGFSRACQPSGTQQIPSSLLRKGERGIWQQRFWEHSIRDETDFNAHCDYIHYNPVKHGLVENPGAWPYTTFHRFVEQGMYEPDWGATVVPDLKNAGRE